MTHEANPNVLSRLILVLVPALLLALIGCSDANTPKSEATGVSQDVLTFPLTVTIATPNSVPPTKPVVIGSSLVQLGARAQVVNGVTVSMGTSGLTTEPDAILKDTWSRGTALLRDRTKVQGTLHAKTRTLSTGVTITTSDLNPAFDPASTLSWKVNYPSGTAANVTLDNGEAEPLAPGRWGIVTTNSGSTLTLRTGVYYLTSLSAQSASVIKLDQARGPVIIYTTNDLILRTQFVSLVGGAPPDLAIIHLGSNPVFVETLFNGAIVAPSATLTLRSVTGTHTGYFAAQTTVLDAGALVQYRAPAAVVGAAQPPGDTCRALLAGVVADSQLFRYCGGCQQRLDFDLDHVDDCVDGCPMDPLKTAPGICGCGLPETDSDGDGVPDCVDSCDADSNNASTGQCGCVRPAVEPQDLKPADTPCFDTACPQTGATCNGAGVCGNRTVCRPATGCRYIENNGISYWFCPGPVTESAAAAACNAKQMHLVRINSVMENRFVQRFVTGPTWIGANSITTSGAWRWTTPTSNNGDQFWQGGATGTQQNMLFSYWKAGAPASQRCAVIDQQVGRWVDVDCTQALGFVCEAPLNNRPRRSDPIPGDQAQPPDGGACVPFVDSGLPDSAVGDLTQLQADIDAAALGIFDGSAKNPPPDGSNTCPDDTASASIGDFNSNAGCKLNRVGPANFVCTDNQSCAQFGSNLVCRVVQDDPDCKPDASHPNQNDPGAGCLGHARCGTLQCPALTTSSCDQIQVCGSPPVDAGLLTGSDLDASPFDPGSLFDGGLPDASSVGSYNDPPQGTGQQHSWCRMNIERPIPEANKSNDSKQGSGGGQDISFRFDPDLIFNADVNPLSLGETKMTVHAAAQLVAGVKVQNLFGTSLGFDKDILKVVADLKAERCTLSDDDSRFEVFGIDFSPLASDYIFNTANNKPIPFLNNANPSQETQACNKAVGGFITAANRAKKAFRDAQQLLSQYHEIKNLGSNLAELCQDMMNLVPEGVDLPFFPGGIDCPPNEPPEITIGRFLDYYQAPGVGQIEGVRAAIGDLVGATDRIKAKLKLENQITLVNVGGSESTTIISVPFAIGPVPMLLQVDAFYAYGISGYFSYGIQFPFNPLKDKVGDDLPIANVKAGVMPHANAGLAVFVGAGGGFGGFSASLGVEGSLSLADLSVPIFAGAGLGAVILEDVRPFENKVGPPVSVAVQASPLEPLTHFGLPKSFKFNVWFDYGAAVDAQKVLAGTLNATLRVKFFFFSRTWRKEIVHFNGFSFHKELVGGKVGLSASVGVDKETVPGEPPDGGSADKVSGNVDMGLSETRTQLGVLAPVDLPDASVENLPVAHFDAGALERPFYDNECCGRPEDAPPSDPTKDNCLAAGVPATLGSPPPCCAGFNCVKVAVDLGLRCVEPCHGSESSCNSDSDCCPNLICNSTETCQVCGLDNALCVNDHDCCGAQKCSPPNGRQGVCWRCRTDGETCTSDLDCCAVAPPPGSGGRACGAPNPTTGVRTCTTIIP